MCNHPRSTKRSECWDIASPSIAKHQENEIPKEWFPSELPSPITTSKSVYPDEHLTASTPVSTAYPLTTSMKRPDSLNSGYPWSPASTQKTKSSSQEGDQCASDGFMGDSENCRKFYRCVSNQRGGFIRYEFSCSEATIWDDDIRSCNHPWAVRKRSCGRSNLEDNKSRETSMKPSNNVDSSISSSQQQTQISYGSKVSQTQTQISHGSVIQNQTQINYGDRNKKQNEESKQNQTQISYGSAVSQTQTQIDHGSKGVQTQLQIDHSKDTSQSQTQEYQTTSKSPTTQDDDQDYGGQSDKEPPSDNNNHNENKCTESGFIGDSNDCKKFYRCVDNGRGGFTKYDFTCGEGTVWDSEIEACNHAWAVKKCGGKAPETSSQSTVTNQPFQTTQQQTTTEEEEDVGYGNQNQQPPQTSTTTHNPVLTENNQNKPEQTSSTKRPLDQPEGNECHSSGFMGDKNDCKIFYRCVDNGKGGYTRYEFSCGEGTVWDNQIDACNHAWAVEKCGGDGSSDIQKEPTSSAQPTMSDEYVDTSQMTQTEKGPEEDTDEDYSQPSPSTTSTTQKPYVPSNNTCTQEGFVGDTIDCKKFYRCVDNGKGGYTRYEFTCGEGTVWDQEILGCNHDTGTKQCKASQQSQSSSTSEGSTDNVGSTTMSSSTENQQTTQKTESEPPPQSSNDQCKSEGFYANQDDCKKFYRCVDNGKGGFTKYDFSCGDGTIWVQEIQACDHDNDVSTCSKPNNNRPTTTTTTKTTQATEEQAGSSESLLSTTTVKQSQQPNKEDDEYPNENSSEAPTSNDKCNSEGFYPNTNDCRRFYRCVNNDNGGYTKYDFSCGEGTAWDSDIETCNHISEVKACQGQGTQSNPMQDEDSTQSSSDSSSDGTESSKPTNNDTCEQEGYYGNSQDCKKFYRCVDNGKGGFTKYDFDCGEGTIWDQDTTTCNHPQDVSNPSCKQSDSNTSSTSSSSSNQSSSSTTENNNESSDCSQESSSKKPANKNVNCTEAGYYADPDDCKKFYRCVDWDGDGKRFSVYHFECGEGTIWDPALDTCNHEESVYPPRDCNGSQSQAETVEQESTTTEEIKQEETTTQQLTTEQTTTEESTTTQKTTESSQENTTAESEQTTSAEQTTEQSTTQQTTENTVQTTEMATTTTTQQTNEEQTTTQQMTEQTTQESTTSQQTTSEESYTTESNDQQSTTEQTTESTTQQSTTENQTEENQTEASQTEENKTEENQTEESQTEESQTEESDSTTESSSSSEKECPETDDDQNVFVCPTSFKRHPKYCNLFYQCTEDDDTHDAHIATFHCPNNTIYDESQVKCVEEDKAEKKCNGEIAQKRRFKRLDTKHKEPVSNFSRIKIIYITNFSRIFCYKIFN